MDLELELAGIKGNRAVPYYVRLREIMLAEIRAHREDPDYVFPPESFISKRSGLGMKTVRRALLDLAERGVITRQRGKGTFINAPIREQAQALDTVGVIVNQGRRFLRSSFAAQVLEGVELQAADFDWRVSLYAVESQCTEEQLQREILTFINHANAGELKGVILLGQISDTLAAFVAEHAPSVVVIDHDHSEIVDSIVVRNFQGGYAAMDYLLELGHERIAYVIQSKYPGHGPYLERLQAYQTVLQDRGLSAYEEVISWSVDTDDGPCEELLTRLLASSPHPTAIFACDDEIAAEILRASLATGIKVPEELSVVGFDDFDYTQCLVPSLTTVRVDKQRLGAEAASLIATSGAGEGQPRRIQIPTQLVIRGSCAPVAGTETA